MRAAERKLVRCDGPMSSDGCCSNCTASSLVCTYVEPTKKRGPKNATIEDLRREIRSLKAKLKAQSPTLCAVCAKPLEFSAPEHESTSNSISDLVDEPDPAADDLNRRFTMLSLQTKYYGSTSSFRLLTNTIAMKAKHLGTSQPSHSRRTVFWDTSQWEKDAYDRRPRYVYPADDLVASLLALYWENIHPIFPILHKSSFMRSVSDGLHLTDMEFGGTLLSVLAVASWYSSDPRVFVVGDSGCSAGWEFANQVQNLRLASKRTIYEIYTYFLLGLYAYGTSEPRMTWMFIGLGIRALHEHREFRRKLNHQTLDPEHEKWKRAFWTYLAYDRILSAIHGWPIGLTVEEHDVEPVSDIDDDFWDQGFTQPAGKPSQLSYLTCYIRLCEILKGGMRHLYGSKHAKEVADRVRDKPAVPELDSSMNGFLDSIPPHLRWNADIPQDTFFDQAAMLHMTYNYVMIVIHRPHIQNVAASAAPSLSICARAARAIIHTADTWFEKRQLPPLPCVLNLVFVSAVMLVLCLLRTTRVGYAANKGKDLERIETALKLLKYAECRYQSAGRLWDLLRELRSRGPTQNDAPGLQPTPLANPSSTSLPTSSLASHEYYTPPETTFELPSGEFSYEEAPGPRAGMSVEEMLADADPLNAMGSLLDADFMPMWIETMNFSLPDALDAGAQLDQWP
ncbi:fungal-trans domain-containing protein [Favolaschia claudopus]|uniref:Fungal-trans domain-containing protein n=1 Tax=Favolaschia claudopus TaxID=2862362 RepID=A0AAW0DSU0_9AGAR